MKEGNPKAIYLKDYQQPNFWISHVDLRFELFEDKTIVHAELQLFANEASAMMSYSYMASNFS